MRLPDLVLCHLKRQFLRSASHKLFFKRCKTYYATTPIYYVNSVPHIGHLYTTTLADTACRWKQLVTDTECRLATGTDEYGSKVMKAAAINDMETIEYCNKISSRFKEMCDEFGLSYHDFIRTTEERHKETVQHFWEVVQSNGYIYKGIYEGWYCTSDETFLTQSQVEEVHNKSTGKSEYVSIESGHAVEWTKETNYMFQLSFFTDIIREKILSDPDFVYPSKARNAVLKLLDEQIGDLSISRERSRVPWGIPVPRDSSQTIYVWMDALVNYLTVSGYPRSSYTEMWPADVHFIGVDILKFHAIFWPAFLMAAGIELPKQIVASSHWTIDYSKMSKSKGNVVDPFDIAGKVTAEGFKYFLLRQGVLEHDCNYTESLVYEVINADLVNVLGNCLNRAGAKKLNPQNHYPPFHKEIFSKDELDLDMNYIQQVKNLPAVADSHCSKFHFYNAIHEIISIAREANMMVHRHQAWKLDEHPDDLKLLESIVHSVFEGLRVAGILLQPMIPTLATKLLDKLNIPLNERTWVKANKVHRNTHSLWYAVAYDFIYNERFQ
uniref:Methionine--tRNA ligase, mitochondrial n=1 Tax=Ciona intestinalis TaxID=7719 RepID=F7B7E9_CIOIN